MAKIVEDVVVIKFSKLVKASNSEDASVDIVTEEVQSALEQVAQELVGGSIVVEVERIQA